ncbi:hypothetical protein DFH09DRAFT_1107144 [Mycena vulgaris]|nr:hypothetical protein DFH09DRAFT_1107144 [Mycena vulgaris]
MEIAPTTTPINTESSQESSKVAGKEVNVTNNTGVAKDEPEVGHAKNGSKAADTVFEQDKVENTEDQKEADEKMGAGLQYVMARIESEAHANAVLRDVIGGKIGFDIEFTGQRPTPEEKRIEDCNPKASVLRGVPENGNLALKTYVEEVLGYQLSKDLSTSNWKAATLEDVQIEYARLNAIVSLRLYEVLVDALTWKSIEISQDIPTAWYTFNSKLVELTGAKLGWDGAEVAWWTSDCTWYGQGKFIGYL